MAVDDDAPERLTPSDIAVTTSAGEAGSPEVIEKPVEPEASYLRAAVLVGLSVVLAIAGLGGWFGFRVYQSHQSSAERNLSVQVARQGALNLTTIDYEHAEEDIQRILDSATGAFYDDFSKRSQPFIDVVKKAQAKSTGTVTEAGIESETDDGAEVLVSVNVETINAGSTEQTSRAWRMRILVSQSDGQRKVANVAFVP
ncbi:MAG: mammalian cell entry protein [Mycobacterium sp.]